MEGFRVLDMGLYLLEGSVELERGLGHSLSELYRGMLVALQASTLIRACEFGLFSEPIRTTPESPIYMPYNPGPNPNPAPWATNP